MNGNETGELDDGELSELHNQMYQEWLEEKRKMRVEDETIPYEPRDREEFINKHELSAEKD